MRHGGQPHPRSHVEHVGQDAVAASMQAFHPADGQQVGPDAGYIGSHRDQHSAQLLHVRFARSVVDRGRAFRQDGGHHDVGRSGNRSLVQEHVSAFQTGSFDGIKLGIGVVVELRTQSDESVEMRIHSPAAYLVPARFGNVPPAETRQERSEDHDRPAQTPGQLFALLGADVVHIHLVGLKDEGPGGFLGDLHPEVGKHLDEDIDILYVRHVAYLDRIGGEQHGADHLQRFIFCSLGDDFSRHLDPTLYPERTHVFYSACYSWLLICCRFPSLCGKPFLVVSAAARSGRSVFSVPGSPAG